MTHVAVRIVPQGDQYRVIGRNTSVVLCHVLRGMGRL
jgi:hypothetical protein